jgi:TRAP-type C4-dicarboxylate transport system substrate-binding protein
MVCIAAVLSLIIPLSPATAEEQVITLKMASHVTPSYKEVFPKMQAFVDRISELGKDRIKAELHHSEKLFKVKEIVPALMNGSCDIAFHTSIHTTEMWPEIGGISLPFLYKNEKDCRDRWLAGQPLFELMNQEMDKKYGVRILASGIMQGFTIVMHQIAPVSPDVFKGLKIRTAGKSDADFIKACGGSPVFLPSSKINEALKLGMLDGITTYPATIAARNLDEFLDYMIESEPIFCAWGYQIYALNKTLNNLPDDVQAIIMQAAAEYDQGFLESTQEYHNETVRPRLEKKIKFVSPEPDQMKKFIGMAGAAYDEWAKSVDKDFAKKFLELSRAEK